MDSSPRNPIPTREEEENPFKESVLEVFYKLFTRSLFDVIAFMTTVMGEALFITYPYRMKAMVFMFVLYFLLWFLETMLPQHTRNFQRILVCIKMVIGSVSSVLILTIISSPIAWLTVILWVSVFGVIAYYRCPELGC